MFRFIKQFNATSIIRLSVIVVFAALYAGLSLFRHWHFGSWEDLAMFDQMLWNVRDGRGLVTSISGNQHLQIAHHFFSEHVSPILYLLAWPAGLTRGPEFLLVIQALVMALSAWPVARIVASRLNDAPWAGTLAAVLWLSLPGLWLGVLYDFHMEVFEALFLFAFWLALMKGRMDVWLWAVLYVACKEDAPIYLAFAAAAGGCIFQRQRLGFSIATACAFYALLALVWIGPAYSDSGHTLVQNRLLTPAAAGGIIPWLQTLTLHSERWIALGHHLLGFGGLPLLGGLTLLPGMAAVGIMWLSTENLQYTIDIHYSLTVYPLLLLAAVEGARNVRKIIARACSRVSNNPARFSLWYPRLIALALMFCVALIWITDGERVCDQMSIRTGLRHKGLADIRTALRQIPTNGTLATSLTLAPHVARREKLSLLIQPKHTDWMAIRTDTFFLPLSEDRYNDWMQNVLAPGTDYGFVGPKDSFVAIFQKGGSQALNQVMAERNLRQCRTIEAETMHHRVGGPIYDIDASGEHAWQASNIASNGAVTFGYYLPLPAGRYIFTFRIRHAAASPDPVARLDVVEECGRRLYEERLLTGNSEGYRDIALKVRIDGLGDTECRVFKIGKGSLTVDHIRWEPIPD